MDGSRPHDSYVYSLGDLPAEEWRQAGGKASTLARLRQDGHPVPDALVVLPSAFAGDELTAEAWAQVQAHLARLRRRTRIHALFALAVRSSAMAEDSSRASYAGEFETVLNVITDDEVREAIRTVRRSRHSERVRAYAQAQSAPFLQEIAVIVQRLVPADLSGVLFTADPVTGSHAHMTGNFVSGLGDRLVSGQAQPLAFRLTRPKGTYEGPPQMESHARPLFRMAQRLERDLDGPQDIEWATAGGKLYLLQSRPITTLQGRNAAS